MLQEYCGLKGVHIEGVKRRTCPNCTNEVLTIPRTAELHQTIAAALAAKPMALTGAELRFLRKQLGWSADDLAANLLLPIEKVVAWEDDLAPIPSLAEEMLRRWAISKPKVESYTPAEPLSLSLNPTAEGWALRAAG
jgi:DNA-binding transcriptional regulator YiaG